MNCTDIHNLLDDALDGQLTGPAREALDTHLGSCAACRQRVREEQSLRSALKALPVEHASSGFAARALRHAVEVNSTGPHYKKSSFVAGFAAAAVAGFVFLFVGGIYNPEGGVGVGQSQSPGDKSPTLLSDSRPPAAEITIGLHETQRVKLAFNSSQAVQQVRISLTLPEHVELEGYAGRRQIAWSTNLKQGENVLTLPLIANSPQGGEFIARIEHGSTTNELRIKLNVDKAGLSTLDALSAA